MTKKDFLGHCFCSWRFNKLLWMIETQSIADVKQLQEYHKQSPGNHRYSDLEVAFKKRLGE
jgi:hypothetical protein